MSNVRAGVLYLWSRISFIHLSDLLIGDFEYTSKSNTEFQECFMSLCMISWSFVSSKTCGRAASGEKMWVESIFSSEFRFCHPSQRNEHIKMWETHPNDYWVFSKMADPLSPIPWSSTFQDGGWVKLPTLGTLRRLNSLPTCVSLSLISVGCLRPHPRAN